ncbi:hypothetical protein HKX48_005780 [Thoreauomyces humboldtii]|nr:hypothetical protein HKX48_005780 [Thoreauomyces humboldtii]
MTLLPTHSRDSCREGGKPLVTSTHYGSTASATIPVATTTREHPSPRTSKTSFLPPTVADHLPILAIGFVCTLLLLYITPLWDMAFPFRAWSFGGDGAGHRITVGAPPAPPPSSGDKVSVDLFVMSKCPDAVYCEGVFANVLARVGEITDLKTHYIAALNETAQYGTQCKHGPDECRANAQQLCFRDAHPSPARWFNFVLCTNRDFRSGDAARDVACAKSVHVDYDVDVTPCLASARARELAVTDARVGISRGIQTSCTVQIKQETRCVRDGGAWSRCEGGSSVEAFTRSICEAYKGANRSKVAACADVIADDASTGI